MKRRNLTWFRKHGYKASFDDTTPGHPVFYKFHSMGCITVFCNNLNNIGWEVTFEVTG